jgi:hypothetical protein
MNPWGKAFLSKITDTQLVNKRRTINVTRNFMIVFKKHGTGLYSESAESSPRTSTLFLR